MQVVAHNRVSWACGPMFDGLQFTGLDQVPEGAGRSNNQVIANILIFPNEAGTG